MVLRIGDDYVFQEREKDECSRFMEFYDIFKQKG